jgi:hypothetical protein
MQPIKVVKLWGKGSNNRISQMLAGSAWVEGKTNKMRSAIPACSYVLY